MSRTSLAPATGATQWLGTTPTGQRLLRIRSGKTSREYEVEVVEGGYNLHTLYPDPEPRIVTHRVRFEEVGPWSCDCPDARNRPERTHCCKHVKALRAAIDSLAQS